MKNELKAVILKDERNSFGDKTVTLYSFKTNKAVVFYGSEGEHHIVDLQVKAFLKKGE
jgi:hypothetical protein